MITLKNDVLSIEVDEKNPIYKALSRFVGEFFIVHQDEQQGETKEKSVVSEVKPQLPETITVSVNAIEYLDGLNRLFLSGKSVSRSILLAHAERFFGSNPAVISNCALVASTRYDTYPTLVKLIDGKMYYTTIKSSLVKDI